MKFALTVINSLHTPYEGAVHRTDGAAVLHFEIDKDGKVMHDFPSYYLNGKWYPYLKTLKAALTNGQ